MCFKRCVGIVSMALFLCSAILSFGATEALGESAGELFTDAPSSAALEIKQEQVEQDPTIVRSRYVRVNLDLLDEEAKLQEGVDDELQEDVSLILNLFSDISFIAQKERIAKRAGNNYTWYGRIEGEKNGQAILVVQDGDMAGNIALPWGMYQIRPLGNGVHAIYEIDQSAFPDELPPTPVELPDTTDTDLTTQGTQGDDGSIIDVMVVYTLAAANASANIAAEIQLAIDETNTSYANSNITQRLNLVHTAQVSYAESGNLQTDRNRLQNPSDGYMDNVHTLRNTYCADLVSLWVETGGGCGIAYIMTTVSTTFESYGFSVAKRSCATGYYTFGHELGHIMSARHDWYVDPTNNSPYTYNHGYVDPNGNWRTVMAYSNACGGCTRLKYWSNPNVSYGGTPMGVPEGQYHAADNHKTLNNTAWTVANFRDSTTCGGGLDCSNPVQLTCGVPYNGDTTGGVSNAETYGTCGVNQSGPEIVHVITTTTTGDITATLTNETSPSTNVFILPACDASAAVACANSSATYANAPPGTYYIVVDGYQGATGSYTLTVTGNCGCELDCTNPVQLSCGVPYNGETTGGTNCAETYGSCGVSQSGPEIVHVITTTQTGDLTATLTNETGVTNVFILPACDPSAAVACANSSATYANAPPGTYYIVVDGYQGAYGSYTLTVTCPEPPELDCTDPVQLACGVPYNGDTSGGATNVSAYNCVTYTESGPEVVHTITTTQTCDLTVALTGMTADLDLFILDACDANACVAYSAGIGNELATYTNAPPGTYYIVVDGYLGAADTYALTVTETECCGEPPLCTWGQRQSMSIARSRPAAAQVGGLVYIIGGESSGGTKETSVEEYDPATNTWTPKAPKPTGTSNISAAVINNRVYVPGGYDGTSSTLDVLEIYVPISDTWTSVASMPDGRIGHATASVNGKLYVIGGKDSVGNYVATCYEYNPGTNSWSTRAPMTYGRAWCAAAVVNDIIYVIGGRDATTSDFDYCEAYDPATNTWTTCSPMTTARGGVAAAALCGEVYAIGGGWSSYLTSVEKYDPATDSWTNVAPLNVGRRTLAAAATDSAIYALAGWNGSFLDTTEVYECPCPGGLDCTDPVQLTCGVPYDGDTTGGPNNVETYGSCAVNQSGPEIVHVITTTQTSDLTATLTNETATTNVFILDACNPDALVGCSASSAIYANAPPGTYYIVVDGAYGAVGSYTLTVTSGPDTDGDGIADCADNCIEKYNPDQCDTNGDGYGNMCDPDLNNDCYVTSADLPFFSAAFFSCQGDPNFNPDADLNCDGCITSADLPILSAHFFGSPGPGQGPCE